MLLKDKRVIVTGGLTGIGKATVLSAVEEGAAVVSMSRQSPDSSNAAQVLDAAAQLGKGPIRHLQCDVTDQANVNTAFAEAIDLLGGLDAIVNSAGLEHQGPAEDLTADVLLDQLKVHVLGTAFTNAAAAKHYMTVGGGAIINYASYAGANGMPGMAAYSAAKGGVLGYSRTVAKDWAPHGIRVNVVMPGVITELAESWLKEMDAERRAQIEAWFAATIPLTGKLGKVEDAANLNVFLASDRASFIHGQTIGVDGGMFMGR
jgi:NAD(P)-dependent dehydrogenase (short-subunit alcohol dehydrogenase family)